MTTDVHLDPSVRHDICYLFDVADGNPNGDPDGGNQPRVDAETGQGLVTDVAIKRKIRDSLALLHPDDDRYQLFVQAGVALNARIEDGFDGAGVKRSKTPKPDEVKKVQQWLCDHYVDLRLFGGVLSTGEARAGQIRGPLQFTFVRSVDSILPADHAITRVTQTKQVDIDKGESTEMGGKWTVPYGLYKSEAFFSGSLAQRWNVTSEDLSALYQSLVNMFDHDRSATRGKMSPRGVYVFSHSSALGNAPANRLLELIQVGRHEDGSPARSFGDYNVVRPQAGLVDGFDDVTLTVVYE
jgi:CRISPR-associated protein Csd2